MTANEFRQLALSLPNVVENAHMDHPDFRVNGKIVATLGYPDEHWAMVKLAPDDQKNFVEESPKIFVPAKGGWGRQGSTLVRLEAANKKIIKRALAAASNNITKRRP